METLCKIRDVFDKSRNPERELNLVVKVNDNLPHNIWIEFEEFVLTEALLKDIAEFHRDFSATLNFDDAKMPFWLEGFYGSGKSHFCKIIGHLYQNSQIIDPEGKSIFVHQLFYFSYYGFYSTFKYGISEFTC